MSKEKGSGSPAEATGAQVAGILAAAEQAAAEIEREAREEAERILAGARAEAARQVETAQEGVAALLGQAAELRERIGASPGAETEPAIVPEPSVPQPEVDPTPVIVPEPTPERTPEPTPDPVPEPTPDPVPEPSPDPVPEPTPLPQPGGPQQPAAANGDAAAAKLVALKMAMDGAGRDEIAARLSSSYGIEDTGPLVDDVLARASR
jgi:outer membrane biosynthesis protein TonB